MQKFSILFIAIFSASTYAMTYEKLPALIANVEQKEDSNSKQELPQTQNSLSQEKKNLLQKEMVIYTCRRLNCPCAIDEEFHRTPRG